MFVVVMLVDCQSDRVVSCITQAGGDVRRKGDKFEPFAYLPLDPRALSSKYTCHVVFGLLNLPVFIMFYALCGCVRGGKKSVARFKDVVKAKRNFGGLKK